MLKNYYSISPEVERLIMTEKPISVLEISGHGLEYARLIRNCQLRTVTEQGVIDRIDLTDGNLPEGNIYRTVYPLDILDNLDSLPVYDVIIVSNLLEALSSEDSRFILDILLQKVTKQIFIITPEYPYKDGSVTEYSNTRDYHPIYFLGHDFSYTLFSSLEGSWQLYNVFPKMPYNELPCDQLPQRITLREQFRLAYVIPHHNLTGGVKALLQQIRLLTKHGHIIKVYFQTDAKDCTSAIPTWSDLTEKDYAEQYVIPSDTPLYTAIHDVDLIILGWVSQIQLFTDSHIPVVLWEQGSGFMYGDYGCPQYSISNQRSNLHILYRYPIHLLSVSDTLMKVFTGIYNRKSQLFPHGIDTDFYYPEEKKNEVPVVLWVGNPSLSFKGVEFALKVLNLAHQYGATFKVKMVSQIPYSVESASFPLEISVMPSQAELADIYRKADILLSTSLYESFPLPPLEAMASGTAVIATDNGGIRTYARHDENCLLCEQGNIVATASALIYLLKNPTKRQVLAKAGRETALDFSLDNAVSRLEECLNSILSKYEEESGK